MRLLLRILAALAGMPVLFFLAGFAGALLPGGGSWADDPAEIRIGLLHGLIHYDFALPLDDRLRADFAFSGGAAQGDGWLLVGWGAEGFYTSTGSYADISAAALWQAVTGDVAVIRVDHLPRIPADFAAVTWLDLSRRQYDALLQGILADLPRDAEGRPLPHPAAGFTATDSFWQAEGRFSLLDPCNQWIGRRLRAAGVPFGLWTPTIQSVDLALWRNARPEAGSDPLFVP